MSDNPAPQANKPQENADAAYTPNKPVVPWPRWKTAILIVIALAAVGLIVNSSIQYEANHKSGEVVVRPPPTYVGEAPLSIASIQEAKDSNNNLIIVLTPCEDAALNASIQSILVDTANKIRSVYHIYVGVFLLPADESLKYPKVFLKEYLTDNNFQFTIYANVTEDKIFTSFLGWYDQYLRDG